jgi:hypothetical protein
MEQIAAFMHADPLRPHRERLDLVRLRQWGGGRLELQFGANGSDIDDGGRVVRVAPSPNTAETLVMRPDADLVLPNLPGIPIRDAAPALRMIAGLGIARARIGSLAGYTEDQARFARDICAKLG